jgi:signal transduction histidine kinase
MAEDPETRSVSQVLHAHKAFILREWESGVRERVSARALPHPLLLDHVPELLDRIAHEAEARLSGRNAAASIGIAQAHGRQRFAVGFDLGQVVAEYAVLREVISRHLVQVPLREDLQDSLLATHQVIDQAIGASVAEYTSARDDLLEDEQRRYLTLVNSLECIVVWEADAYTLRFSFVSDQAALLTGLEPAQWMQDEHFWSRHVAAEDHQEFFATLDGVLAGRGSARCMHRLIGADGRLVWAQTRLHLRPRAKGDMLSGVTMDMTELQQALRTREEILALVAHDLRSPLSAIATCAATLGDTEPQDGAVIKTTVQAISRSALQMKRLVDDLLDFASIDAGQVSIEKAGHEAGALLHDAAADFRDLAREKGVTVCIQAEPRLPPVECDQGRILQVFTNLTSNALSVTGRGGVITLTAALAGPEVVFSVSDTGPGIPEEELDDLFERYRRGRARAYRGAGLGLAIAKGLVSAHGGKIWARSRMGEGTTFYFTVPALSPA